MVHLLAAAAAMTATGCCCSAPLAWARPRASPAPRVGRCRAVAAGASDVAFHPDVSRAAESLQAEFRAVDRALALNSSRVAAAFRRARVAPHVTPLVSPYSSLRLLRLASELTPLANARLFQHFGGSTGYGHDDGGGREALDAVFADIVGAEAAIVRPQVPPSTPSIGSFAPFVAYPCLTELLSDVLIPPSLPVLLRHARHCLCAICASEAWA